MTRRLLVRPTQDEDVNILNELLIHPQISCWFLNPPRTGQIEIRRRLVQDDCGWENENRIQLTAISRNHSQGLSRVIGAARIEEGQISYYVAPDRWRQGFGFELVEAVCAFALPDLRLARLYACVLRDNVASRRILERLGFVFCGLAYRTHAFRRGYYAALNFELFNPRLSLAGGKLR